jgi:hypothetical protein
MKLVAIGITLLGMTSTWAQNEILPRHENTVVQVGASFQAWRRLPFSETMRQISFPVMIAVPMGERTQLTIMHIPAFSRWRAGQDISGVSDTWVEAEFAFSEDRGMIQFGLGMPTGKTQLNNNQIELAQYLSKNIFRFQLPAYGQGFSIQAGGAWAFPLTEMSVLGIGVQGVVRKPYHPVRYSYDDGLGGTRIWNEAYDPGDEISGHLGVDFQVGNEAKLMIDGLFTFYSEDKLSGLKVYNSGSRFFGNIGFFQQLDQRYLWTQFRFRQKGKNELRGTTLREANTTDGNQYELDARYKAVAFENGGLHLVGQACYYQKNEQGMGGGNVYGLGIGATQKMGEFSEFAFEIKYLGGTITEVADRKIQGVEFDLKMTIEK